MCDLGVLRHKLCGGGFTLGLLPPLKPRRWVSAACSSGSGPASKKRIVFLGTPDVAASTLLGLLEASSAPDSSFGLIGVVSQPGKPKGRGNRKKPVPSPVTMVALDNGFQEGKDLLCPYSAKEDDFLSCLALWQPDLCITAAYGNFLPKKFLDIPTLGTLNIHPSLLPKYRGAAPVNRTILNGDEETGVSILYTVLKMDAGPILAQERMQISPEIQVNHMAIYSLILMEESLFYLKLV